MKKRILSMLCSMILLCMTATVSVLDVSAAESEQKVVDGSALTMDDSSKAIVHGMFIDLT